MPMTLSNVPQQLTLSNAPQQPQGLTLSGPNVGQQLTLSNVPQTATAMPAPMPQAPIPQAPMPQPVGGLTVATQPQRPQQPGIIPSYNPAAQYREFGNQLLQMIKAGQITPEQANRLKAPLFEATKLGNTAEGYKAMQAAQQAAMGMLPRQGYDAAAQYRSMGTTLASLLQNPNNPNGLTPAQANALKAPIFEATRLGNTNAGYEAMQKAIDNAWAQSGVPRPVEKNPNRVPGMAMGGLMNKYYGGGEC